MGAFNFNLPRVASKLKTDTQNAVSIYQTPRQAAPNPMAASTANPTPQMSVRPNPTPSSVYTPNPAAPTPQMSVRPNPTASPTPTYNDPGPTIAQPASNPALPNNPAPNPNIQYNKLPDTPTYENFNSAPVTNNVSNIAAPKYSDWQGQNQSIYKLERQGPLTDNGKLYESNNLKEMQSGQFGDVESARNATDRANALRSSQALQGARGTFARAGGDYNPEAASRAQDTAAAGADNANLQATNNVNQMQRSYMSDAQTRAHGIESDNQDRANTERNNLINTDKTNYGRGMDRRDYTNWTADSLNKDAINKGTYADGRNDLGNINRRTDVNQHNDIKSQTYLTDLNKATYGDSKAEGLYGRQADIWKTNTAKDQWTQNFNDSRNRFDLTRGDNRADTAWTQKNTEGQQADSRNRFDLTRGDTNKQQGIDNTYRDTVQADNRSRFDLTRGDTKAQTDVENKRIDSSTNYSHTMDQINSIQDPTARQTAYNTYMNGGDVSKFITTELYNDPAHPGRLNSKYASASPETQNVQAMIDKLKAINPMKVPDEKGWSPETPEQYNNRITAMAYAKLQQADDLSGAPLTTATQTQAAQAAATRLANTPPGQKPDPRDLDTLPSVNPQAIPLGDGTKDWLSQNTTGGWTKINGQPYQVVGGDKWITRKHDGWGSSDRHEDFAVLKDQNGNPAYLNAQGQVVNKKPGT